MSWSIRGVPRMTEMNSFTSQRSGATRLRRPNITRSPSGSEPSSVKVKISSDFPKPCTSRVSMAETVMLLDEAEAVDHKALIDVLLRDGEHRAVLGHFEELGVHGVAQLP